MEVEKVFHVVQGDGDNSYVTNSSLQRMINKQAKPLLQEMATQLYSKYSPQCVTIADMGCSSGPNWMSVVSEIIESVDKIRNQLGRSSPEFQVFLNDLPGTDFNTLLKYIPTFTEKLEKKIGDEFGPCLVAGMPGTFYGRLFPANTLSFAHSFNALHWLSQVPKGIEDNRGNICVAPNSPPVVLQSYAEQFRKDFTTFLRARSIEIVTGGCMFLVIQGRRRLDPSPEDAFDFWDLLGRAFRTLVDTGLIPQEKLDTFNLPLHTPHIEEVSSIIHAEGSFELNQSEIIDVVWDSSEEDVSENGFDKVKSGIYVAKYVRAVIESMVASHFGESILDELCDMHAQYVGEYLEKRRGSFYNLALCLSKKDEKYGL